MLRKIGLVLTLLVMFVGFIPISYHLVVIFSSVDNPGNALAGLIAFVMYLAITSIGVFIGTIIWGLGIRRIRATTSIKKLEILSQRILFVLSFLGTVMASIFFSGWFLR